MHCSTPITCSTTPILIQLSGFNFQFKIRVKNNPLQLSKAAVCTLGPDLGWSAAHLPAVNSATIFMLMYTELNGLLLHSCREDRHPAPAKRKKDDVKEEEEDLNESNFDEV
jgi:hypothetical protein